MWFGLCSYMVSLQPTTHCKFFGQKNSHRLHVTNEGCVPIKTLFVDMPFEFHVIFLCHEIFLLIFFFQLFLNVKNHFAGWIWFEGHNLPTPALYCDCYPWSLWRREKRKGKGPPGEEAGNKGGTDVALTHQKSVT